MLMSQKAEVSMEFMVFVGILLIFFVFFVGIIGVNNKDIDESTVFKNAKNILEVVTNEINAAARIEGYYREFYIPEKLVNGEDYNITIYPSLRLIKLEWDNGKNLMSNLQTEDVSITTITPGLHKIKNQGGMIIIES